MLTQTSDVITPAMSGLLFTAKTLGILWIVLLTHLVFDCLGLLRNGAAHLTEYGTIHIGFRAVESLGVVAAPVVLLIIVSELSEGPDAHGVAAIGGLFIVMGVLALIAVVVVLHAAWLLAVAQAEQTAPHPTS